MRRSVQQSNTDPVLKAKEKWISGMEINCRNLLHQLGHSDSDSDFLFDNNHFRIHWCHLFLLLCPLPKSQYFFRYRSRISRTLINHQGTISQKHLRGKLASKQVKCVLKKELLSFNEMELRFSLFYSWLTENNMLHHQQQVNHAGYWVCSEWMYGYMAYLYI